MEVENDTWTAFEEALIDKFLSEEDRFGLATKFEQLKQNNMSLREYSPIFYGCKIWLQYIFMCYKD